MMSADDAKALRQGATSSRPRGKLVSVAGEVDFSHKRSAPVWSANSSEALRAEVQRRDVQRRRIAAALAARAAHDGDDGGDEWRGVDVSEMTCDERPRVLATRLITSPRCYPYP
jgi:hypothetical protein